MPGVRAVGQGLGAEEAPPVPQERGEVPPDHPGLEEGPHHEDSPDLPRAVPPRGRAAHSVPFRGQRVDAVHVHIFQQA